MNIFESIMLICFGFAWPISIYKSFVSKKTAGKSLLFLIVLQIGYVAGVLFKLTDTININLYLYILNFVMITIDELLFLRNRKIEKSQSNSV